MQVCELSEVLESRQLSVDDEITRLDTDMKVMEAEEVKMPWNGLEIKIEHIKEKVHHFLSFQKLILYPAWYQGIFYAAFLKHT